MLSCTVHTVQERSRAYRIANSETVVQFIHSSTLEYLRTWHCSCVTVPESESFRLAYLRDYIWNKPVTLLLKGQRDLGELRSD